MITLIRRLRDYTTEDENNFSITHPICDEAADAIEALSSRASTTNAVISVAKTAIHAGAWVWIFYALSEAAVNAACR